MAQPKLVQPFSTNGERASPAQRQGLGLRVLHSSIASAWDSDTRCIPFPLPPSKLECDGRAGLWLLGRRLRCRHQLAQSPSLLLDSNINQLNALGRPLSLPFEHFRYWFVMGMRLQEAFSGLPGGDRTRSGGIHPVNMQDNGNSVLTKGVWANTVRPGSRLALFILFQEIAAEQRACPVCSYANTHWHSDVWAQC